MSRLALLALLAAAACGGPTPDQPDAAPATGPLQLDDVSILFPLTGAPSQYLAASDAGDRGALLPRILYDAIGHISGSGGNPSPGGSGEAEYPDLRVVAVRLDPCFASLAPDPHGTGCKNQLRVVMQELKGSAGSVSAFDSALHVFYQLDRDELVTIAHAIAALREAGSSGERLGALAPNPLMASQGLDGPMADGVRKLVLRYAGAQNLIRVTKLSAVNTGFTWTFSGFDVTDASAATVTSMNVPTVVDGTSEQSFFRGFATDTINGQFTPPTTSSDGFVPLADEQAAAQLSADARAAAWNGLVHVDNPTRNSPDTIDCASCHLATPVSRMIAAPTFGLDEASAADAFHADGQYVLASELTPTFDPAGPFDVHAFSYVGTTPGINQRTVNESAAIVAYLSTLP